MMPYNASAVGSSATLTCLHMSASLSFNCESSALCLSISPSLCLSISPSSKMEEGPFGSRCVKNREHEEKNSEKIQYKIQTVVTHLLSIVQTPLSPFNLIP